MNLLQTLWSWLLKLMRCSPRMPVSISDLEKEPLDADCCEEVCEIEEDCCDHEDCEPEEETLPELVTEEVEELPEPEHVEVPVVSASAGELLREILLSEGISERVIEKYVIVKTFEGWYAGVVDEASVRASIQDFKSAQGGVIKAKLSRVQ